MTDDNTEDPTEVGSHGANIGHEKGIVVFNDVYECPECQRQMSVTDFAHRTHVGYDSPTIRCVDCGVGTVRIE